MAPQFNLALMTGVVGGDSPVDARQTDDDSIDLKTFSRPDRCVGLVLGSQYGAAALIGKTLDSYFAVDNGHDNLATARILSAFDHDDIFVVDTCIDHRISLNGKEYRVPPISH